MASMQDRMNDAKFNIIVPQCKHCLNRKSIEYDSDEYYAVGEKTLLCKAGIDITKEIKHNLCKCLSYERDEKETPLYEKYGMIKF